MAFSRMKPTSTPLTIPAASAQHNSQQRCGRQIGAVARWNVGRNHDCERHAACDREIEPSLLDNQHLTESDDDKDRGKRQTARQGAVGDAGRREHPAENDERRRRQDNGQELPRQRDGEALSCERSCAYRITGGFHPSLLAPRALTRSAACKRVRPAMFRVPQPGGASLTKLSRGLKSAITFVTQSPASP